MGNRCVLLYNLVDRNMDAWNAFCINALPTSVILDKKGVVRFVDAAGTVRRTYVAEGLRDMFPEFDKIVAGLKKGTGIKQ